ncbi:class I SAM-dependent methyltransferase, partial [Oligoflexia bacterium]|nr:class I SAM-dependent methyltransferase [Oligoflexia bacterium]
MGNGPLRDDKQPRPESEPSVTSSIDEPSVTSSIDRVRAELFSAAASDEILQAGCKARFHGPCRQSEGKLSGILLVETFRPENYSPGLSSPLEHFGPRDYTADDFSRKDILAIQQGEHLTPAGRLLQERINNSTGIELGHGAGTVCSFAKLARVLGAASFIGIDLETTDTLRAEDGFKEIYLKGDMLELLSRYQGTVSVLHISGLQECAETQQECDDYCNLLLSRIHEILLPNGILILDDVSQGCFASGVEGFIHLFDEDGS